MFTITATPIANGYAILSGSDLIVYGTPGNDTIKFYNAGNGQIAVELNGSVLGTFPASAISRLIAYSLGGNDDIETAGNISKPAWFYGGTGNDRLKGGAGADVLLGESDDDLLVGGSGRDLLIGGLGSDRIVGNADDDILIAGHTGYDGYAAGLAAIMTEWTSSRSYSQRVYNLSNGTIAGTDGNTFGSRDNGNVFLTVEGVGATVHDDYAADILTGASGMDWFLFNPEGSNPATCDFVTDLGAAEFVSDLEWIQNGF
jgi:Ca2+-binding RTX toxin-like protein